MEFLVRGGAFASKKKHFRHMFHPKQWILVGAQMGAQMGACLGGAWMGAWLGMQKKENPGRKNSWASK